MTDRFKENLGSLLAGAVIVALALNLYIHLTHEHHPLVGEPTVCPFTSIR